MYTLIKFIKNSKYIYVVFKGVNCNLTLQNNNLKMIKFITIM